MQRQPESSMFESTNRASITIESLSAACDNIIQMSMTGSDSFDIAAVFDSVSDDKLAARRRKSSFLLNRSMESFACSFSSLNIDLKDMEVPTTTAAITATAIPNSPPAVVAVEDGADMDESTSSSSSTVVVGRQDKQSASSATAEDHASPCSIEDEQDISISMILASSLLNPVSGNTADKNAERSEEPAVPGPRPISICSSISSTSTAGSAGSDRSSTTSTTTATSGAFPSGTVTTIDGRTTKMDQPGLYDVVCGRNSASYNCVGNRRFRVSISMNVDRYMSAPTREEKTRVVQQLAVTLIDEVGCRFLKKTGKNQFVEMDRKQIKDKIGHSLRDLVNLKKKGGPAANDM